MAVNEVKLNYDLISEVYQKLGAIVSTLHDTALQVKIIQGVLHGDDWLTNAFQDDTMQAIDAVVETQRALRLKLEKYRQLINEASQELYQMDLVKGKQRSNIAIKDLSLIGWSVISSIIGSILAKSNSSSESIIDPPIQSPETDIQPPLENPDPEYITNPSQEMEQIKKRFQDPHANINWNNPYKDGSVSYSCWSFTQDKIRMRELNENDVFSSLQDYNVWLGNADNHSSFSNTTVSYLKYLILDNNQGNPVYNVRVSLGDIHTMLIDKAYMDNGELRLIFSDNRNGAELDFDSLPVRVTASGEEYHYHPILDPINVSEKEFTSKYNSGKVSWSVSGPKFNRAPDSIVCYGLQN